MGAELARAILFLQDREPPIRTVYFFCLFFPAIGPMRARGVNATMGLHLAPHLAPWVRYSGGAPHFAPHFGGLIAAWPNVIAG